MFAAAPIAVAVRRSAWRLPDLLVLALLAAGALGWRADDLRYGPQNDDEPPLRAARSHEKPAATYSPRPVKAKYHRRCGA